MHRIFLGLPLVFALVAGLIAPGQALAAGPTRIADAYTDTFFDDFVLELCGIATMTTLTERWTLKVYPDGSETLHVVRTFVPHDPRIPVEKGAATSFRAPDGSRRVVGKPIQLFEPGGGIRALDAGQAIFDANGDLVLARGRHEGLAADQRELYCPD